MLKAEQIPYTAALPIAETLSDEWWSENGTDDSPETRAEVVAMFMEQARQIAADMLNAWPGGYPVPRGYPATDIVLPLKKEPTHDEG